MSALITANLRINQLSGEAAAWYFRYLDAIDARDVDAYAAFLAEDVTMQFNNDPAIAGKETVLAMLRGYWRSYAGLTHELLNIYGRDDAFVLEALNHYSRHDGKSVATRAVAFTDRNAAGLATSVRIYADASPVFA